MTIQEFKKIWEKWDGWNNGMVLIFDNSMRWYFTAREYKEKDENGKIITDESQRYGDYVPIRDYFFIDEENSCLYKKNYPGLVTAGQKADPDNKRYYWEVRHIENLQAMIFCDENNREFRPFFDLSQS